MTLIEYISDTARRRDLATAVGCSPDYLWQIATGWRGKRASRILATAIESATRGAIRAAALRPDLFDSAPENRQEAA